MSETEKTKSLCIAIMVLAIVTTALELAFIYDVFKSTADLVRKNEQLQRKIEYQQSVIADMEEDLERKE